MLATGGGASADPLTVRIGWISLPNVLSPVVFEKKEVLKHYGKSYVIAASHFTSTPLEVTAIAANYIDLITIGFSSLASAVVNGHIDDMRIVADGFQDGVDDYFTSKYMVLNDSPIKSIDDLKGKVMVTSGIGGPGDIALRIMLRRHNLEDRRDYTLIEAQFPNMNTMLLQHKADLVFQEVPFIYDPVLQKNAHALFTMKESVGSSEMIMLAARAGFLDKNRAALNDFFEDMLRGMHWFLDPANRQEAIEIVARGSKQPVERLSSYLYTKADFYRDPNGRPNVAALQHDMETQRSFGFLKSDIDVRKYMDLSFIDEAARRLK